MNQKLRSSALVILIPIFLGMLLGLATGSLGLGLPDMAILVVVWVAGLAWVWRPTPNRQ